MSRSVFIEYIKRRFYPAVACVAVLVVSSVVFEGNAQADLITLNGPAANDVDNSIATLVTLNTATTGTIVDLNVSLDLDAACCGYDDTVILTHLDTGTSASLWIHDSSIGFGDVLDVTFDDEATVSFFPTVDSQFPVLPGAYQPATPLAAFDGEDLSGTWQLSIQDTFFPGEGDDLLGWSIIANTQQLVPEPNSLAILSIAFVCIAVRSQRRRR